MIHANYVVAATGPFQRPVIPPIVPTDGGILQVHSNAYRNPDQLPPGAVLVVGGGSSGAQIADELLRAGRRVYLSVSSHGRPPRSYRGRDFVWWLGVLNKWDMEAAPGSWHTTIAVSGSQGGQTVDFRRLAEQGMTLLGTTKSFDDGVLTFAADLADNLTKGDEDHLALLDEADAYVRDNGVDLPEEPTARETRPTPACVTEPILELNLADADVRSIVWATGFVLDFSWLKTDAVDAKGQPVHHRGVSAEPGIYFVGLPWQTRRGSSFIWVCGTTPNTSRITSPSSVPTSPINRLRQRWAIDTLRYLPIGAGATVAPISTWRWGSNHGALGAAVRFAPDDRHACPWLGELGLDDREREHRPLVPDEAGVGRGADRAALVVVDGVVLPCRVRRPRQLDVERRELVGMHVRLDDSPTSAGSHTSVTFWRCSSLAICSSASRPTKSWSNLITLPYPSSCGVK